MSSNFSGTYVWSPTEGGWKPLDFRSTPNGSDTVLTTWARLTGLAVPAVDGLQLQVSAAYANSTITLDPNTNVLDPRGVVAISVVYARNAAGTALVPGRMVDETAATLAPAANASVRGSSLHYVYDGTNFVRALSASVATLATLSPAGALLVASPGEWSITHTPAAATQATITRAASAGQRHVCKSITATLIGLAASAEATLLVNLRDGVSGAGAILWSTRLLVTGTAGSQTGVSIAGLNILGASNTAMTLEFSAAGGASTFQTVALTGVTTT